MKAKITPTLLLSLAIPIILSGPRAFGADAAPPTGSDVAAAVPEASSHDAWSPPVYVPDARLGDLGNLSRLLGGLEREAAKRPDLLLLAKHFRSLKLVIDRNGDANLDAVAKCYAAFMVDWTNGPASWQAYLDGRPLLLAWESPVDGEVQSQLVVLPERFDLGKAYPLYVELHARSPRDSRLEVLKFSLVSKSVGNAGYPPFRDGIYTYPWGRGVSEYHGIGIASLDEALDEIDAHFNTDPARQYLFGFSMGGGGTWTYGAHTMKRRGWAALGVFSSTVMPHLSEATRLKDTPVWICWGAREGWKRFNVAITNRLAQAGNPPASVNQTVSRGHSYEGPKQDEMLRFLRQQTQASPVLPNARTVVLRVDADDTAEAIYLNGRKLAYTPSESGPFLILAKVREGENTLAVKMTNVRFSERLLLSATLPDGGRLVTDDTWKCRVLPPSGDWTTAIDRPEWEPVVVHGDMPTWFGKHYEKNQAAFSVFEQSGAQFIGHPKELYYRVAFDSAGGEGELVVRRMGERGQFWLNGKPLADVPTGKEGYKARLDPIPCTLKKGRNVLALQTTVESRYGSVLKAGLFHPDVDGTTGRVLTGRGWRVAQSAPKGWFKAGFDDSAWHVTGADFIHYAYDGGASMSGDGLFAADFMAPGVIYFHNTFTVGAFASEEP